MKLSLVKLASISLVALVGCADSLSQSERVGSSRGALGTIEPVTSFGTNAAGLNMYRYVPQGMPTNAPLVVALHGCNQGAADMVNTGLNDVAEKYKFYVAYPEQTSANNFLRCFNWFDAANLSRGQGENQSIKEMIDKMKADYSIDPARVFALGFSSGGAEAAILLATWPDLFAAGVTFAGIPYHCAESFTESSSCINGKDQTAAQWGDLVRAANPGHTGAWPRLSIWQGTADTVVHPSNATQLLRQWSNIHGLTETPTSTDTVQGYPHSIYKSGSGVTLLETYTITGKNHGVPVDSANACGTPVQNLAVDASICGPLYAAQFFGIASAELPLPACGDAGVSSDAGDAGDSGSVTDAGPCVADAGPKLDASADARSDASSSSSSSSGSSGRGSSSSGGSSSGSSGASSGGPAASEGDDFGSAGPSGCGLAGCRVAPSRSDLGGLGFGAAFALAAIRRRTKKDKGYHHA